MGDERKPYTLEWEEPHFARILDAEGRTLARVETDDAVIAEDHDAEVGRINAFVKRANDAPSLMAYKDYIEENLERIERGGWTPVCFPEFMDSEERTTYETGRAK